MKPGKQLRNRSAKREQLMRNERVPLVKRMLEDSPPCALGIAATSSPSVAAARLIADCEGRADCVHERRRRSQGGSLTKRVNLATLCSPCNNLIESDADVAAFAHRVGLVVRRGDPEWEEMG